MLNNFDELVNRMVSILGGGIATLLMTVAFIVFLVAVINFILKRRNGEGKGLQDAGSMLWWSVFGLFIMVAVWGLVNFLAVNLLGSEATRKDVTKPQTNFGRGATSNNGGAPTVPNGQPAPFDYTGTAQPGVPGP